MSTAEVVKRPLVSRLPEWGWIAILALAVVLAYIGASVLVFRPGFPLDDAWIHQTYARNLAFHAEWAFIPGLLSAGSTSPLWTILLAPGFWIGLAPYYWTWFLGWLTLTGIGLVSIWMYRQFPLELPDAGLWVGLFMLLEWHLIWAAVSGMETLLFSMIVLAVLGLIIGSNQCWFMLGLLIGVSVWIRPDGLTLLGPALAALFIQPENAKSRLRAWFSFGAGFLVLFAAYLLFNLTLSGSIWPNTFFAKQAEYAILRELPLLPRFLRQTSLVMVGPGSILLPGFFMFIWKSWVGRKWTLLIAAAWPPGFILMYAIRLPVVYQHGRYIIPAMGAYFIFALVGLAGWVRLRDPLMWKRALIEAWIASLVLVSLIFSALGGRAFALDVAVIESEMVSTARWIAKNTMEGSLIAAHDIGALGFFGGRPLVDMAGLVSPEVVPFIRDERLLGDFMDKMGVEYLMTFPGWYPLLRRDAVRIYQSDGIFSPAQGGESMQVFRWH